MIKQGLLIFAVVSAVIAANAKSAFKDLSFQDGVLKYNTAVCAAKVKVRKCPNIQCKRKVQALVKIILKDFVKTYSTMPPESADNCSGWV